MRVAVVGFGHLGNYHAQKVRAHQEAQLVGIVDPNADRQAEASRQGYEVLGAWQDGSPNAVIVASPTSTHFEICKEALEADVHVLVEKPIASTSSEGLELADIANRHARVLQVGHVERFNPAYRAIIPELADVRYVTGERLSPFSGRSTDTDVVADLMIHDLDIVASVVESPLLEVRAVGVPIITNEIDMASARLEFDNGCVVELSAGRSSLEPSRKIRFITPSRYISIDYEAKEVKCVKRTEGEHGVSISMDPHTVAPYDQLEAQFDAFYQSCKNNAPVVVNGEAGARALELAERVKETIKAHQERLRTNQ